MSEILAVRIEHAALRFGGENRLDAAGKIDGEQTDGAGRRDGQYMTVADAVCGDGVTIAGRQAGGDTARQEGVALEGRKCAVLVRECVRRLISLVALRLH